MTTEGMSLRLVRAAILAAVAGFVGLSGHVYAGGLLPDAGVLCLVYVLGVAASAGLLGRQASAARILLLTVGGQFVAHTALSLTGGHLNQRPVGLSELGFEHLALEARGLLIGALGEHGLMTFVHLLASIAVGLWLAVGEQTLWGFLSTLGAALSVILRSRWTGPLHLSALAMPDSRVTAIATSMDPGGGSVSRRGPPAYVLAA